MSHTISLSEAAYQTLSTLANEQGTTPEALIEAWAAQQAQVHAESERDPYTDPRYQTFDEFFLGLGMTEDEIREAKLAAQASDADVR
jgi:hypothetical protein